MLSEGLLKRAVETLYANVVEYNGRRCVVPHVSYYPWIYCWDTALHVIALSYVDPALAKENVEALLSTQGRDGMIPNAPTPKDDQDMRSQPPLIIHAVRRYAEITADIDSVRSWYDRLAKFYWWWRRRGVPPSSSNSLASPFTGARRTTDLIGYWAVCSTGMDNHPIYDGLGGGIVYGDGLFYIPVKDLLLNSILAESADSLSKLAEQIGRLDDKMAMRREFEKLSHTINAQMWYSRDSFYYPLTFDGEHVKTLSCQGFTPLIAGIPSRGEAERLIQHLTSPREFWTEHGITSIAQSDPKFMTPQPSWLHSRDPYYWRGPIWAPIQYITYAGLRKYGENRNARRLAENWLETMGRDPLFPEYYYPDGSLGLKKLTHFSWTAAVTIIFLNEC
ncbi:MAG: trehalase family glycosidase [Nitrososphaerota archaeon]